MGVGLNQLVVSHGCQYPAGRGHTGSHEGKANEQDEHERDDLFHGALLSKKEYCLVVLVSSAPVGDRVPLKRLRIG